MNIGSENILEAMEIGSKSELGIIALIVVSMSIVCVVMFRHAKDSIKAFVYVALMFVVCGFSYASIQILQEAVPEEDNLITPPLETDTSIDLTPEPNFTPPKPPPTDVPKNMIAEKGYIYLGTYRDGKWIDPRFKNSLSQLNVGDIVELNTQRKMFGCPPYRKSFYSIKYTFCNEVVGTSEAGQNVKIIETPKSIGLSRVWGYVEELK